MPVFGPHGFAGPTWLDPGAEIRPSPFTTGFTGGLRCGYKLSSPSARGIFHPPSLRISAKQPDKLKKLGILVVNVLEAAKVLMIKSTIFLMMPNLQVYACCAED